VRVVRTQFFTRASATSLSTRALTSRIYSVVPDFDPGVAPRFRPEGRSESLTRATTSRSQSGVGTGFRFASGRADVHCRLLATPDTGRSKIGKQLARTAITSAHPSGRMPKRTDERIPRPLHPPSRHHPEARGDRTPFVPSDWRYSTAKHQNRSWRDSWKAARLEGITTLFPWR
jgi:hypothetical protein